MKQKISSNLADSLRALSNGGEVDLQMGLRNGKTLQLGGDNFKTALAKIAPQIATHDPAFLDDIRRRVSQACASNSIDPDKFVFDRSTIQKMQAQSRAERATNML